MNWNRPFVDRAEDAHLVGAGAVSGITGDQLGTLLRPIGTPLVMSGFEPGLADMLGGALREQGFVPMGSAAEGSRAGEMPYQGPLKPGDAIGVMFVTGDLRLGGTGTVTHIDNDRVYAFGHPMYNLGPTEFPMTRAYVYTVLPSLSSSLKLSSTGDVIGTFLQDLVPDAPDAIAALPFMRTRMQLWQNLLNVSHMTMEQVETAPHKIVGGFELPPAGAVERMRMNFRKMRRFRRIAKRELAKRA